MFTIVTSISVFTSEWVQELLLITTEPRASLMLGKTHTREKWIGALLTAPDTRRTARCNGLVFLFTIFLMWTIFKVFIEFVTILLLSYVLAFWLLGMWDLSSPTRHQTHAFCIERRNPERWSAREVPWSGVFGTEKGTHPFENEEVINCKKQSKTKQDWTPSVQFSSVAQSCPTLCDPMNRSTPGLAVHHHLPEFTQTHVHRVSDAIQPSHPLSSPSPLAPNPSQHQSLFQWVNSSHEVAKVLEVQL